MSNGLARCVALLIAISVAACGGDDGQSARDWGPLAAIDGPPSQADALAGGVLSIGDDCVTLGTQGGEFETTLAWPSESTTWNPGPRTISYTVEFSDGMRTIELTDGDEVSFGGGFKDSSSNVDWLIEPDPSCPGSGGFYVGGYSEGFETGP